jgi:hypothetical protein
MRSRRAEKWYLRETMMGSKRRVGAGEGGEEARLEVGNAVIAVTEVVMVDLEGNMVGSEENTVGLEGNTVGLEGNTADSEGNVVWVF